MAVFNFTVPIYGFDQWSGANTNSTTGYGIGTTFRLNDPAALSIVHVQDDDGNPVGSPDNDFHDGFIDVPGNGSNPSNNNNDQLLTQDISINGRNFQVGDQIELEFAFTTTTGETFWVVRIDGVNVGISGPVLPTPGTSYTVQSNADSQAVPEEEVPCFTDGAMVNTPSGPVAIEDLKVGDLVSTLDSGAQPILWLGSRVPSPLELMLFPMMRPVLIRKDAFGPSEPSADMVVSPQHRFLISSAETDLLFGETEVLASAVSLINGDSICWAPDSSEITYRHILLAEHEILIVNGVRTESLYPGTDCIAPSAKMEMELLGMIRDKIAAFVRPALKRREAMLLHI